MGGSRKIVVGHWRDPSVAERIAAWADRCSPASSSAAGRPVGDNMRQVAVTEGTVEAQIRLGVAVNGYGVTDLVDAVQSAQEADVDALGGVRPRYR